jgi:hypothetical protein
MQTNPQIGVFESEPNIENLLIDVNYVSHVWLSHANVGVRDRCQNIVWEIDLNE